MDPLVPPPPPRRPRTPAMTFTADSEPPTSPTQPLEETARDSGGAPAWFWTFPVVAALVAVIVSFIIVFYVTRRHWDCVDLVARIDRVELVSRVPGRCGANPSESCVCAVARDIYDPEEPDALRDILREADRKMERDGPRR